ncbi:MAG: FAD-dependent oxidoreductase [Burkholderiales bacterium]
MESHLVLLGGGHSHVAVLKSFAEAPIGDVKLTLVTPYPQVMYSGMLPGFIAGHYSQNECHVNIATLAHFAKCEVIGAYAVGLDTGNRNVILHTGEALKYDLLSINTGSVPRLDGVPGAREFSMPVKPAEKFWIAWSHLLEDAAARTAPLRIAVVGGGAAGVELVFAMQYRLLHDESVQLSAPPLFHLVNDMPALMPRHNNKARAIVTRILAERDVTVHSSCRAISMEAGVIHCDGGYDIRADYAVWATGPGASAWVAKTGLALDAHGFIAVNDNLRSISHSNIFAAGDIASQHGATHPKSGVYALRQGPPLAENLRAALKHKPFTPYAPQKQALAIISAGDKYAIATRGNWAIEGSLIWKIKDRIDRRFIEKYNHLVSKCNS